MARQAIGLRIKQAQNQVDIDCCADVIPDQLVCPQAWTASVHVVQLHMPCSWGLRSSQKAKSFVSCVFSSSSHGSICMHLWAFSILTYTHAHIHRGKTSFICSCCTCCSCSVLLQASLQAHPAFKYVVNSSRYCLGFALSPRCLEVTPYLSYCWLEVPAD